MFILLSFPRPLQNFSEVEVESRQDGIPADDGWIVDALRRLVRPVNGDAVLDRVEQPSEVGAVSDVFFHLLLNLGDAV